MDKSKSAPYSAAKGLGIIALWGFAILGVLNLGTYLKDEVLRPPWEQKATRLDGKELLLRIERQGSEYRLIVSDGAEQQVYAWEEEHDYGENSP